MKGMSGQTYKRTQFYRYIYICIIQIIIYYVYLSLFADILKFRLDGQTWVHIDLGTGESLSHLTRVYTIVIQVYTE